MFCVCVCPLYRCQMYTLWAVKAAEGGKDMYGDDYADVWAINRLHFKAATPPHCDHVSLICTVVVSPFEGGWMSCIRALSCRGCTVKACTATSVQGEGGGGQRRVYV